MGTVYAVGVAIGSMLCFNFFFLPPLYTLTLQDERNWFALLVFLVTAVVVSELASRSRRRAVEAEAALQALQELTEERERLAQEAVEAEALRRSDALKTALLRAVSHDLRSPLMAILTSASALTNGELSLDPDDRRELTETILGEADRLDRIVSNLLDLSRLQAGAAVPEPGDWPADDLVLQAIDGIEVGSRVEVVLPEDDSPFVHADRAQSERIVANLIENALRYSPPDEPVRVQVRADRLGCARACRRPRPRHPAERGRANLRAVPARLSHRHNPRRRARPRDRARLRRGERRARLGRVARRAGRHIRPRAATRADARRGFGMTGQRVLVVDDEQQILRALRTSLRGAGYEVETADTAETALAAAAMRPPEAVILDLVLPDGTGTDVARELRTWSTAPIIVLSAVGDEREKVAALDAGADDYVTKPVGIDELLARLRAVLRRTAPSGEPVVEVGELVVDLANRTVTTSGESVHLTPHQFDLLRVFALNVGKLLTHRQLLQEVWGPGLRRRGEPPAGERLAVAAEDRARPDAAALPPHGDRRRLPARRACKPQESSGEAAETFRRHSAGAGVASAACTTSLQSRSS